MHWRSGLVQYHKKRRVNPHPGKLGVCNYTAVCLGYFFFFFFLKEGDIFSNLAVKEKGR